MTALNGFSLIRPTAVQEEPFHSRFLAIALCASLDGDRALFDGFWKLTAPSAWPVPQKVTVHAERHTEGGKRIDLCICDEVHRRMLGIEIKTRATSARKEQLREYEDGLVKKNQDWNIAIAYLTPFNRDRAGNAADRLPTVRFFKAFADGSNRAAQHASWLDVADLQWEGGDIWRQHQAYVREKIAPLRKLNPNTVRNRTFTEFFGEEAEAVFWEALAELGVQPSPTGVRIELDGFPADPRELAQAFEILVEDGAGVVPHQRSDRFAPELREPFLQSPHHEFHAELFRLAQRFANVWIEGAGNYGVRVAHECPKGSVSLVTSVKSGVLKIGEPR